MKAKLVQYFIFLFVVIIILLGINTIIEQLVPITDPYLDLGFIKFRKVTHIFWLIFTFTLFITFNMITIIIQDAFEIIIMLSLGFIFMGFMAAIETKFGISPSKVFSIDCIWYNPTLSVCHLFWAFFTRSYYQKAPAN